MGSRRSFLKKSAFAPLIIYSPGLWDLLASGEAVKKRQKRSDRLRIIVETDAGGDPDDEQSLVRFLVYSNEFDIEGIIANRPVARERENINPVRDGPGIVKDMIGAYADCYPSLKSNHGGYPDPELLLSRAVAGYDDTDDGVNLIIRAVDSSDPRPVWFCNWGTDHGSAVSCMKRALDRVMKERGREGYAKFKDRLRLSTYDKFEDHTSLINPPFRIWIDTFRPPIDNRRWYHRFSAITAKAGGFDIEKHVRTGHGPLGARYPVNTSPLQKEGDTMSFLYLLPYGLSDPEHPSWGGWGGRYGLNEEHPGKNYYWANQSDDWNGSVNRDNTLARWAEALQNDFRARMEWCVKPYNQANHHPVAIVNRLKNGIVYIDARPGQMVKMDASASFDPDGRNLNIDWFIYPEAGTCREPVQLEISETGMLAYLKAPVVSKPETIHVVFSLRNDGEPPLYSYRRVVIQVNPK